MNRKLGWLCLALALPGLSSAQFDLGSGPPPPSKTPWTSFKLNPKTRLKLDFHNAGIDAILSLYQKQSGVTIVKDPALTGGLTLTSAKAVPLSDAFNILSTTLDLKGYQMLKQGNLLVIKQKPKAAAGPPGGFGAMRAAFQGGGGKNNSILKVYPITYANASQLAATLNDVFQPNGQAGGFMPPWMRRMAQQQANQNQQGPLIRASSDDFSNSVIINAPDAQQTEVADLIKKLDKPSDTPQSTKVYHLKYASSDNLLTVVNNVLSANVPKGRGGATTGQQNGRAAFFNAIRGITPGAGQAESDPYTNSLVVTATDDVQKIVSDVITSLDKDVPVQGTTFVLTLNNAKAADVAQLLQGAFGTRPGLNSNFNFNNLGGRLSNNGLNNSTNTNNRNTAGGARPLGGSIGNGPSDQMAMDQGAGPQTRSATTSGKDLQVQLQDPKATSGELLTHVGVTQRFGFFGQQNNQNQQNKPTSGRDASGRLINVQDLTGQVTVIPDINTNSLIIVTNPENEAILRNVVAELDRIPEQVMIQTIIVEATLDKTDKMGVEWKYSSSLGRILGDSTATGTAQTNYGLQSTTPALQGLNYTIAGANLSAFLNALQSDSKFQILSTPRIFTSNNQEAQINVSQSVPYILSSQQNTLGNFTYNYAFQDVGVVLDVTPQITTNGYVTMQVTQTANDLQGFTSFNAPIVNQREAQTTVSVRDGQTIILGGIIRKQVTATTNKIPILGDIPILGNIFRSTSNDVNRTELLVFLTPHIVRNSADAQRLRIDSERQMSPETKKSLDQFNQRGNNTPTKKGGG